MEQMGIIVDVNIDAFDLLNRGNKVLNRVGKYAVVTFARNIISARGLVMKRLLDIVGSLVGMIILGIVTVIVAPAIKLESPGPVFFGQTRIGKTDADLPFTNLGLCIRMQNSGKRSFWSIMRSKA